MTNRVIYGKRGDEVGLFVSKVGVDVSDLTATGGLMYNSNVQESPRVIGYGQGILGARTTGDVTFNSPKTIYTGATTASHNERHAHNLGYAPMVFARWTYKSDMYTSGSSVFPLVVHNPGVQVSTLTANWIEFTGDEEEEETTVDEINSKISYGFNIEVDSTYLYVASYEAGGRAKTNNLNTGGETTENKFNGIPIYYSYVITDSVYKGVNL
jgi:hypothetical protein